ncbi:MAG: DNRLRE domain-containing protein [Verrucomicrobiota bacterium]
MLNANLFADQMVLELDAERDTAIFEGLDTSSGIGTLFIGRVGSQGDSTRRRALIAFDIAQDMPADSVVLSATLQFHVPQVRILSDKLFTIHRAYAEWGEGTSFATKGVGVAATANDATWDERVFDEVPVELWQSPGGDFVDEISAAGIVNDIGVYRVSSLQLAKDVQDWIDGSKENFGWFIVGDERAEGTALHITNREALVNTPKLEVVFLTPPMIPRREQWLIEFTGSNDEISDLGDLDFDGVLNGFEYSRASNPNELEPAEVVIPISENSFSFIRDPRARDLTYRLEFSEDLSIWDQVLVSEGGRIPEVISGFRYSEISVIGSEPVREVLVFEGEDPVTKRYQFARLVIERN